MAVTLNCVGTWFVNRFMYVQSGEKGKCKRSWSQLKEQCLCGDGGDGQVFFFHKFSDRNSQREVFNVTKQPAKSQPALELKNSIRVTCSAFFCDDNLSENNSFLFWYFQLKRTKGQHHKRTMTSWKDWLASESNPWFNYMRLIKMNRHFFPIFLLFLKLAMHKTKLEQVWCVSCVCPRNRKQTLCGDF